MSVSPPSPYATHADLSQLRREIQQDVRYEVRELTHEVRQSLKEMAGDSISSKQFFWTTVVSVFNMAAMVYYAVKS
jgi:hypothetical protein